MNFAGPMDLVAWEMNTPPLLPDPADEQQPWDASPVRYATADDRPVLTVHGTADTCVSYAQAAMIDKAMTSAGATHVLLTLPGQSHAIDLDAPIDVRSDVLAFYEDYLLP